MVGSVSFDDSGNDSFNYDRALEVKGKGKK